MDCTVKLLSIKKVVGQPFFKTGKKVGKSEYSYFSTKPDNEGTQTNHLSETVLLSTKSSYVKTYGLEINFNFKSKVFCFRTIEP